MKLNILYEQQQLSGWQRAADFGLDVAGLAPGAGEAADAIAAARYALRGDWFNAALSLISMIPAVGDIAGKGTRYFGKGLGWVAKHENTIRMAWPMVRNKLAKHVPPDKMPMLDQGLNQVLGKAKMDSQSQNMQQQQQKQQKQTQRKQMAGMPVNSNGQLTMPQAQGTPQAQGIPTTFTRGEWA